MCSRQNQNQSSSAFLPLRMEEVRQRGWDSVDFVCVTGDSYVDHPSFGIAIIARVLEAEGFRVAMLAQPDCRTDRDLTRYGRPRLGFFVTSGNIDSMVSHYTAAGRKRSDDPYTAGNKAGRRPDRAVIVYSRRLKECYPDCPVMIGGLEASFRRFAHYDYWEDAVRPSILADCGADLLSYGMGELQTREIARRLAQGQGVEALWDIRGTCRLARESELPREGVSCASYEKVRADKRLHAKAYRIQAEQQDHITGKTVIQKQRDDLYLVQNPPMRPLTSQELDQVFDLPFARMYHPCYEALGGVKAIEEVEFSIMHNRGCFGGCNFCSIAFHQGRSVVSRGKRSVLREGEALSRSPRFKGYIHDVGGATANFRGASCKRQLDKGMCTHRKCLAPTPCPNLEVDHREYLDILRALRELPGVKKVFVRSGLRFDYINLDSDNTFLKELVAHHVSGQLKVAPEHCSPAVLDRMGKPHIGAFVKFKDDFLAATKRAGKEQYLVPYLMSSHPGSTLKDAVTLAQFLKKHRLRPEQVQDFYPTPGTASTCMFYTGLDPFTMEPVYVARDPAEKAMQRALLQYFRPENRELTRMALQKAGRRDLIGMGPECLVPPAPARRGEEHGKRHGRPGQSGKASAGPDRGKPKRGRPYSKGEK